MVATSHNNMFALLPGSLSSLLFALAGAFCFLFLKKCRFGSRRPNATFLYFSYIYIMKKSTVIHTLNELPKEFKLDEFLERLIVIQKIDEGLEDAKAGNTVNHDKVKKLVAKWHK
jgi:hypothetical protein